MTAHSYLCRLLALALLPGILPACGPAGTEFNDVGKSKPTKSEKKETASEDEDEPASEPTMVAGAFLTCAHLTPAGSTEIGGSLLGCGIYEGQTKLPSDGRTVEMDLFTDKDQRVPMTTLPGQESSPWHILGNLPAGYHDSGYIHVREKDEATGKERIFKIATRNVKAAESGSLATSDGNEIAFDPETGTGAPAATNPPATAAAAGTLKSFTAQARWNGGSLGFTMGGITPKDFCNDDGSVRTSLGPMSVAAASFFSKGAVPTTIEAGQTAFSADNPALCFKKVGVLFGGGSDFALEGGGGRCLYVRVGEVLHIVRKDGDATLTLDAVRKMAAAKACAGG